MKQETETLLAHYRQNGWTVGDPDAPSPVIPEVPGPRIIPIRYNADYSPEQIRSFMGIRPDSQVVSIHSGVLGNSKDTVVLRELARVFRKAGYVVCNGGMPSIPGPMHDVVEGAFDQESENGLEPFVSVITESLFERDNVHGRYPNKDMRVLLMEDSVHRPSTILRAHILNMIANVILTFRGGLGTVTEFFHEGEGIVINPTTHKSPLVAVNLDGFYDHMIGQLDVIVNSDGRIAAPRIRAYSSNSSDTKLIVQDLLTVTKELIKNPHLPPNKPDVQAGKFWAMVHKTL